MQPDDSILFSKRACWISTALLVCLCLVFGLTLGFRRLAWVMCIGGLLLLFMLFGFLMGLFANRVVITRLKLRYPDTARRIEDYRFGRGGWDILVNPIITQKDMLPFVADDPQREQMLAERRRLERFGLFWRWGSLPPMLLLAVAERIFS